MGERKDTIFRSTFNYSVGVEESKTALTGDTGALLLREVAERLGLCALVGELIDHRDADKITHPLYELMLSRVLLIAQGWRDQDDADSLRDDPAFRIAVTTRGGDRALLPAAGAREAEGLASQPTMSRLTSMLGSEQNRRTLSAGLLSLARSRMRLAYGRRPRIVLDVDSFARETYGQQEGSAYNGHYRVEGYHPLVAFTDTGDIVGVMLRPGNVHTANDVRRFLTPIIDALKADCDQLLIRIDAGYANGELFAWLANKGVRFITRLPSNPRLHRLVVDWQEATLQAWAASPCEDGRPRHETREFWHMVDGWTHAVRVVAVLVERDAPSGELFHHTFFLATNLARPQATSEGLLKDYRQRGTGEVHIGELVRVMAPSLSSVQRSRQGAPNRKRKIGMAENEVSLLLAALAYELVHALRCIAEIATGHGMSLDRVRERLLKVPASVVRHARSVRYRIASTRIALWKAVTAALPSFGSSVEVAA